MRKEQKKFFGAWLLIITTACFVFSGISAQENKTSFAEEFYLDEGLRAVLPSQQHHILGGPSFPASQVDFSIDVISYELYVDWVMPLLTQSKYRPLRKFEGHVVSFVRAAEPIASINWNAKGLMIDSILIDGVPVTWTLESGILAMVPVATIPPGDTVRIDAYYACLSDARGFVALADSDAIARDLPHAIAYTMSEPEDARRWFPCHDIPSDKALFTVHARVPVGFTVVSNGTRQDSVNDTDTTSWQTWHHPEPMSTYLVCINASIYSRYDMEYVSNRTIPISNYQWPEDEQGVDYSAHRALVNLPKMFEAFESMMGPYPWDTYGHVTVSPIQYGGMEHQSMTTVNRRWLVGDVETGYAHELAHQWLGDAVTCETWGDIWLNEGGASFSEALWREWNEGPQGYLSQLLARRNKYLEKGLAEPAVYGIPITDIFNEGTTYCKSAWVYHMMRRLAGDDAFFAMLKSWVSSGMHQSRQTYMLLDHVQQSIPNTPVPWDVYFDQWLRLRGHPVFVVVAKPNDHPTNGIYSTQVRISQSQTGEDIPEVFITPLTVRVLGATQIKDTVIFVDERTETITVSTPFLVDSCRVDPNFDVLCQQAVEISTDVDEDLSIGSQIIAPSPVHRGSALTLSLPARGSMSVRVHVLDGSTIYESKFDGGAHMLNTTTWPIGVVTVIVESNGKTKATMIPVIE